MPRGPPRDRAHLTRTGIRVGSCADFGRSLSSWATGLALRTTHCDLHPGYLPTQLALVASLVEAHHLVTRVQPLPLLGHPLGVGLDANHRQDHDVPRHRNTSL